jgi:nucleoside-diphosphate-sugar epimerase
MASRRGGRQLAVRDATGLTGRSIALTGGRGFIGAKLHQRLEAEGASVRLLPGPAAGVAELVGALDGCDTLIHLGYQFPTPTTYWSRLEEEVRTNVVEAAQLLAAAERSAVGYLCFASSVSVYRETRVGAKEGDAVGGPTSPYATAKLLQEHLCRSWGETTRRPIAILRLATVYGAGERVNRAIPNFIRSVLAGCDPSVNGRGVAPFEPIHVTDVAEAFAAAVALRANGTFNIGTGVGWAPRQVAALIIRLCHARLSVAEGPASVEAGRPICDVSKAADELGFRARVTLRDGLQDEIEWFRRQPPSPAAVPPARLGGLAVSGGAFHP